MNSGDLDIKKRRAIIVTNITALLVVTFCLVGMGALLYNAYVGVQTRATLVDCVEPEGGCAQESSSRTAEAVDRLIKANALDEVATRSVVVFAAVCSEEKRISQAGSFERRVNLMELCVNKQLRKKEHDEDAD